VNDPSSISTSAAPTPSGFWSTIREAIRGSSLDFTAVPIGRAVVMLAVPMVLEMVMESLFAVVDIFWVSRLGAASVASVGLTESMLAFVYAVAMGLAAGATALVARRVGEGKLEDAKVTAVQAVLVGVAAAALLGMAGSLFAPSLLAAMGADAETVRTGSRYTAIMFGGNVTIVLLFVINAIFRGAGDAAAAMRTLWLSNLLNIALGPCFIFGWGPFPELGVTGAAVGTNLGRGIGVVYQFVTLARGARLPVERRHWQVDTAKMRALLRVASTATFQTLIETASWLGLVRILATFGSASLAGYTIAIRVVIFALLPSWGLANAAATLVGQNLGANQPSRAERAVWLTGFYNLLFLGAVAVIFVAIPRPIVLFFTTDEEVVKYAVDCLRIVSLGFVFFAYGMVMVQSFNGAGDTVTPSIINFVCFWLLKIPLAYALAKTTDMGAHGVYVAITIAYATQTIVAILLFRRGHWKAKRV
jgi:putative MATE family efflux protein